MPFLFLIVALALLPVNAFAELNILKIQADGKKLHVTLDNAKDYKLGDIINFYENKKLVTQGKIAYITPRKSKALVTHFKGKPFQSNYMARVQYLNRYLRQQALVAQKNTPRVKEVASPAPAEAPQRQLASITAGSSPRMRSSFSGKSTQDLLYYPEAQSFLLSLEGNYSQNKLKVSNIPEITVTEMGIHPTLYYSPFENLSVGFGISYGNVTEETTNVNNEHSGIGNPRIHVGYQLLSEREDNVQWILGFQLSPSIGETSSSTSSRGNTLIVVDSYIGKKYSSFSWGLIPALEYYTETKTKNSVDDQDAYLRFIIEAEAQYDFTQRWALYSPFLISYTGKQKASDGTYSFDPFLSIGAGIGFKYALSAATNIFFNGRYEIAPSVKVKTSTPSTHDGDQSGFIVRTGMNFKF